MCVFGRVRQAAGRHDAEEEAVQHTELSLRGGSPVSGINLLFDMIAV